MTFLQEKLREYCGIFGIVSNNFSYSIAGMIYPGLMAIQHRGQSSCGISVTSCDKKIYNFKDKGIVSKVLNPNKLKSFSGNVGIGHVACSDSDSRSKVDMQPYHFISNNNEFSIAINGIITNSEAIKEKLKQMGRIFVGDSDVELLATLIESLYKFNDSMDNILIKTMEIVRGVYSMVLLSNEGTIYIARDPSGCKPLCFGNLKLNDIEFKIIASESCALDALGGSLIRDVMPGEIIKVNPLNDFERIFLHEKTTCEVCLFEFIYFARPDSIIDGTSVFDARYKLGINLAKRDEKKYFENAIVVPIPDSGRSAAMGYAWQSSLDYEEGLIKNRYVWHPKIDDIKEKLNTIKSVIHGKNVILVDDSILSGETMRKIISMLKNSGALSIHVRISSPPIVNQCIKNSRISTKKLLIASEKKEQTDENYIKKIKEYIGADSLKFQTVEGLENSIGLPRNKMCLSCFSNDPQVNQIKPKLKERLLF